MTKIIPPDDLIPFDQFLGQEPIEIDLVYANPDHPENVFGGIYHPKARMLGHKDLVQVVLGAARQLQKGQGWVLVLKDCLRTVNAQARMIETPIVQANPHWLDEPRFLSSPGQGGHPRGMAVDVAAKDKFGQSVEFGTAFDHFSASTDAAHNPAHRHYPKMTSEARQNRDILEAAMMKSAANLGLPLLALPQEWWDFRFPAAYFREFAPIDDTDLPPELRMTEI